MRELQKLPPVPKKRRLDERSVNPGNRSSDGCARLVDPWSELDIARPVVPELVRDDRLDFSGRQRLQQRQSDTHDLMAPESHGSAAMRHPSIDLIEQVDICRFRLARRGRYLADQLKQARMC
jgi:hypothetical protein